MSDSGKTNTGGDPLFSDILAECPELWDVVDQFVRDLPRRLSDMEQALDAGEAQRLALLAGQLSQAGRGHGYAEVARRAAELASASQTETLTALTQRLSSMKQLVDEIQRSLNDADPT